MEIILVFCCLLKKWKVNPHLHPHRSSHFFSFSRTQFVSRGQCVTARKETPRHHFCCNCWRRDGEFEDTNEQVHQKKPSCQAWGCRLPPQCWWSEVRQSSPRSSVWWHGGRNRWQLVWHVLEVLFSRILPSSAKRFNCFVLLNVVSLCAARFFIRFWTQFGSLFFLSCDLRKLLVNSLEIGESAWFPFAPFKDVVRKLDLSLWIFFRPQIVPSPLLKRCSPPRGPQREEFSRKKCWLIFESFFFLRFFSLFRNF